MQLTNTSKHETTDVNSAVNLFKAGGCSLGQASKLAGMALPDFIEYVSRLGIPVVNYDPAELDREMDYFGQ